MKPMLACDYVESKLKFPLIAQPKIDGVRGLNLTGKLTGRSLKTHDNIATTAFYSHPVFIGLDGELAANEETHADLCRLTTSAVGTIKGTPFTLWHLFDIINERTLHLPYEKRLEALQDHYNKMRDNFPEYANRVRVIPHVVVGNLETLLYYDTLWLAKGYEGTILRDPNGKYKQGRSTPTEGGLLRIKRFTDGEAVVDSVEEGQTNNNEATINPTGHTERSTHQENMVPNGMVGRLNCTDCKTGLPIIVAPGRMPHADRIAYLQFPERILKETIKYKHFNKGVKDKPRFPTFQCIKAKSDIPPAV